MARDASRPGLPVHLASAGEHRSVWSVLVLAAVVPPAVTAFLDYLNIPLGCPGRLVYLYSPVVGERAAMLPFAILLAGALGVGVWLAAASEKRHRQAGLLIVALGAAALAVWSYLAPPEHYEQHVFNAHSPSHDGAFVTEALHVDSLRDYLQSFPQHARTPPEEMRGTRVISNPPGATVLAVGARGLLQAIPVLDELAGPPAGETLPAGPAFEWFRYSSSVGLIFFWLLTALWLFAGVFLYLGARLFWPPAVAAAYALCCVFSPMTLLFTPGKDPAQLLTVALPLCLWVVAVRHQRGWVAGLAGCTFVIACLASLVHIWLAGIVIAATWLGERRTRPDARRPAGWFVGWAAGGAVLTAAALYLLWGLDLIATARAVAHAQAEVTRGASAMPLAWQLLGVPLFLLFVGPAWWTATLWLVAPPALNGGAAAAGRSHDADASFGRYLLLGCALVMLATVGFTNLETPRLWIPFVPLLLLGALTQVETLRSPSRRMALILAVLVGVQVASTALQWTLMDMREAETRLSDGSFFG